MLKRLLALALLAPVLSLAQTGDTPAKPSVEAIIKRTMEGRLGGVKVDAVAKTPYLGLYEVRVDSEIFYTDEKVNYIITGSIIDGRTMQNMTEKRQRELSAIKWENLPLESAIKTVRGNGKRTLAIFADPNCGYCKRFEKDLAKVDDVTIYTFLYPILSEDSHEKSKAIWCAADKSKAWSNAMLNDSIPAKARCDTPIEKNLELGRKYRITGTPTLVFHDGQRVPGQIPLAQLEKMLVDGSK
jgi:thiol:disulfide interchange protein DsbC